MSMFFPVLFRPVSAVGPHARTTCVALAALILLVSSNLNASVSHGLDSNSRVEVKAVHVTGKVAKVLFATWADRGDENFGRPCSIYYYLVHYSSDGSASAPRLAASNICGSPLTRGGLLANGDVVLLTGGEMQYWRNNKLLKAVELATLPATKGLAIQEVAGAQKYYFAPSGNKLFSLYATGYMQRDLGDAMGLLVSLKPDDRLRWEMPLRKDAFASNYLESWLGDDGSALVHRANNSLSGTQLQQEDQLIHISSAGKERIHRLTIPEDLSQFEDMKAEDLQRYYDYRQNSDPESLKKVSASVRAGGGFDVLFQRKGGGAERSGFWLRRLDASGAIESEHRLGEHIIEYGLDKWLDFYVDENELVLLSRVLVTQTQVPPGKRAWTQNAVSWIPLDSGAPRVSRMLPLDMRYLEKALNTGDEQRQYLDGFPGTEAFSLENLNGTPLVTGRGWVERKWALRLALATNDLPPFNEAIDNKRQAVAKRARSKQKKEDRAANKKAINASMAAAVGLSPEKYAAMSKREQAELMISQGDMSSVMAVMEQQAKQIQQAAASQQASAAQQVSPGAGSLPGMTPEQQAQLASIPGMSPEQLAQIQGALAQAGVMGAAGGISGSSASAAASSAAKAAVKGDPLPVDAAGRAFIDYSNPAGNMTQLRVFDRKSNKDLLSKQYDDGVVYEYLNFSAFGVPLSQIGVVIKDAEDKVLVEMTPVQG